MERIHNELESTGMTFRVNYDEVKLKELALKRRASRQIANLTSYENNAYFQSTTNSITDLNQYENNLYAFNAAAADDDNASPRSSAKFYLNSSQSSSSAETLSNEDDLRQNSDKHSMALRMNDGLKNDVDDDCLNIEIDLFEARRNVKPLEIGRRRSLSASNSNKFTNELYGIVNGERGVPGGSNVLPMASSLNPMVSSLNGSKSQVEVYFSRASLIPVNDVCQIKF